MPVVGVSKFYSQRVRFGGWEGTMLGNFIAELGLAGKLYVGNNFYRRGPWGVGLSKDGKL